VFIGTNGTDGDDMNKEQQGGPPAPGAADRKAWQRYALEVNGYELAGGADDIGGSDPAEAVYAAAMDEIKATGALTGDHDRLRIALFVHQRHLRVLEPDRDEMAEIQRVADVILTALQEAA
jgi:hypothetical protein